MHLEILVEEPSAGEALGELLPKIIDQTTSFRVHAFSGKHDLLRKLPQRLRGYSNWLPPDYRILVLIDQDQEDCRKLKDRLNQYVTAAGLAYRRQVLNRIVIAELEAWFLGDLEAVCSAFPKVPASLHRKATYRDPDGIRDSWETLERILQRAGYYRNGMPKIETARAIARQMEPARNRSRSFQCFHQGVLALTGA